MAELILVPGDGSEHAFRALQVACVLAKAENRTIRLLHVVPEKTDQLAWVKGPASGHSDLSSTLWMV